VVGFGEDCLPVDFRRLVPAQQGQLVVSPLLVLGWAEAVGARAIVLLQNQPGPRHAAPPVDLLPTLKLATAANLFGLILVDHVLIHSIGAPSTLRQRSLLAEAQALAAHLQQSIGALSSAHPHFGLRRPPEPKATLP
jgi:hypothetical protein